MLIRTTTGSTFECTSQEQHAYLSGVLASAWDQTRLDPRVVQIAGVHDTPWRRADQDPLFNPDTGLPHDFITYPMDRKVALYRRGLDEVEDIDPLAAYLVSLHYTTFSGTRDYEPLTVPEQGRRERLSRFVSDGMDVDAALAWIKFFDILSLFVCLTGPRADPESIPRWLGGGRWQTSPDDVELGLEWRDDDTLTVAQWPFAGRELELSWRQRVLEARFSQDAELQRAWRQCEGTPRTVVLEPRG